MTTPGPKEPANETSVAETLPPDLKELYLAFEAPDSRVEVSAELSDPHRLVAQARSTLEHARTGDGGILVPRSRWHLDLEVTQGTLDRALRIMDALIQALDRHGIRIGVKDADDKGQEFRTTTATVLGEKIAFDLTEKVQRSERPLTREEKQKLAKDPYFWIRDKYVYTPTGNLRLRILESHLGFRASWSDARRQNVEGHLNDFAKALVLVANKRRLDRAERERRQREWDEEARRRREREEAWELAQKQRKAFDLLEERWRKSCRIREFAAVVEREATGKQGAAGLEDDLVRLIEWARAYADAVDPFKEGPFLTLFKETAERVQLEPRRYFW